MELARVIFAPSLRDDLQAPSSGPTLFLGALGLQGQRAGEGSVPQWSRPSQHPSTKGLSWICINFPPKVEKTDAKIIKLESLNGGRMCPPAHHNKNEAGHQQGAGPRRGHITAQSQGVPWSNQGASAGYWQCTGPVAGWLSDTVQPRAVCTPW